VDIDAQAACDSGGMRYLVNGRAAARSGEWAQHFSNASCIVVYDAHIHAACNDRYSHGVALKYRLYCMYNWHIRSDLEL